MLSAFSHQLPANEKRITNNDSQAGFSPLAILILVVLGVFIFWELNSVMESKFTNETPQVVPSPSPLNGGCNFPDPNDPCDLDSGLGFNL